jgi:hypothetical protein
VADEYTDVSAVLDASKRDYEKSLHLPWHARIGRHEASAR